MQGQIRLRLSLGTREDRGLAQCEDNWKEVCMQGEMTNGLFIDSLLPQFIVMSYSIQRSMYNCIAENIIRKTVLGLAIPLKKKLF